VIEIRKTHRFVLWLDGLKDVMGRARIQARLERLALGHKGDCKAIGAGVQELRFQFGPGYRVYFTQQGDALIFLLAGGDKSTQSRDIEAAIELAQNL
jgi:putative addiction module killer protein